jgi:hypothetical protein
MIQGCFTSSVLTFTKPCAYPPLFDLKFFICFIYRQKIWPEARFNALGAFVFLRYVYIEISQMFMVTALKIHLARRGFSIRDRHRNTAK